MKSCFPGWPVSHVHSRVWSTHKLHNQWLNPLNAHEYSICIDYVHNFIYIHLHYQLFWKIDYVQNAWNYKANSYNIVFALMFFFVIIFELWHLWGLCHHLYASITQFMRVMYNGNLISIVTFWEIWETEIYAEMVVYCEENR